MHAPERPFVYKWKWKEREREGMRRGEEEYVGTDSPVSPKDNKNI